MTAIQGGGEGKPNKIVELKKPLKSYLRLCKLEKKRFHAKTVFPLVGDGVILGNCIIFFLFEAFNPTVPCINLPFQSPLHRPTPLDVKSFSIALKSFICALSVFIEYSVVGNGDYDSVKAGRYAANLSWFRIIMVLFDLGIGLTGMIDVGKSAYPFFGFAYGYFFIEVIITIVVYKKMQSITKDLDEAVLRMNKFLEENGKQAADAMHRI